MNATLKSNHRRVLTLRGFKISRFVLGAALAGLYTVTLSASPLLNGSFNITGNITVSNFGFNGCTAAGGCITWTNPPATLPDLADISGPTGVFNVPGFAGAGKAIVNTLTNPPDIVNGPILPQPQVYMSFVDINPPFGGNNLNLTFIPLGIYFPGGCSTNPLLAAVGQTCTTPGSLFNFVNNPGLTTPQATATWVFQGVATDGSTWQGNFTSQFPFSFQQVLLNLQNNGSVTNSYSATISASTVPEPGPITLSACGLGLLLFSAGLRRKIGRSNS